MPPNACGEAAACRAAEEELARRESGTESKTFECTRRGNDARAVRSSSHASVGTSSATSDLSVQSSTLLFGAVSASLSAADGDGVAASVAVGFVITAIALGGLPLGLAMVPQIAVACASVISSERDGPATLGA